MIHFQRGAGNVKKALIHQAILDIPGLAMCSEMPEKYVPLCTPWWCPSRSDFCMTRNHTRCESQKSKVLEKQVDSTQSSKSAAAVQIQQLVQGIELSHQGIVVLKNEPWAKVTFKCPAIRDSPERQKANNFSNKQT